MNRGNERDEERGRQRLTDRRATNEAMTHVGLSSREQGHVGDIVRSRGMEVRKGE